MKGYLRKTDSEFDVSKFSLAILLFTVCILAVYFVCCGKSYPSERNDAYKVEDYTVFRQFQQFMFKYNKTYGAREYEYRLNNFKKFLKRIERLNGPYIKANRAPVHGVTKFADMSQKEFRRKYLNYLKGVTASPCKDTKKNFCNRTSIPEEMLGAALNKSSVDWRKLGYVGGVVDQRTCYGCWAASIVGVMETMAAIKQRHLQQFSIQRLIDCDEYNDRCQSGNVLVALRYLCFSEMEMAKAEEYPDTWRDGNCRNDKVNGRWKLFSYQFLCNPDVHVVLRLLEDHGPLVVQVDAHNWQSYVGGGVLQWHCNDDPRLANHAVQLVGYNLNDDVPYYIVRNSWGKEFGDDGYLKLEIAGNICGVRNTVSLLDVTL